MNKHYEEYLQRCFDEDLNDEEMKLLFSHMSSDEQLRKNFRSLIALKNDLRRIPDPVVPPNPHSIPQRYSGDTGSIRSGKRITVNRMLNTRIAVRVPVLAVLILAVGLAGYISMTVMFPNHPRTEYVYVVEMPPVIIHSSYSN